MVLGTDIMPVHDMVSLFLSFSWARPELILDGSAGREN